MKKTVKKKNKFKLFIIAAVCVFTGLVAIAIGLYYIPVLVLTRDWKSYTNEVVGYKVKVPSDFKLEPIHYGPYTITNNPDWEFVKRPAERINWNYTIASYEGSKWFKIIVSEDRVCDASKLEGGLINTVKDLSSPILGVDNYVRVSGLNKYSNEPYWISDVCFIRKGKKFRLTYVAYQSRTHDDLFPLILDTFEFTK